MNELQPIRRLATVTGYPSLIEALRARVEELKIAHKDVDALAGCAEGYTSKVLGPSQVKALGMQNLWPLMWALGIRFAVENDPEALALMEQQFEKREEKYRHPNNTAREFGKGTFTRFAREMGRRGGYMRNPQSMHPKKRKAMARHAARAKWAAMSKADKSAAGRHAAKARWAKVKKARASCKTQEIQAI